MNQNENNYQLVYNHIKQKVGNFSPQICLILGSGLGVFASEINKHFIFDTNDLKGYPKSTVSGHKGNIIFGEINEKKILAFQGRIHYYEGYSLNEVVFPIILAKMFNISTLITTNVSGGINPSYKPGDIVFLDNHINLTFKNPISIIPKSLRIKRKYKLCEYEPKILNSIHSISKKFNIELKTGTYLWTLGPSYETPAEILAFKKLGADMVGMSTVPEVIIANYFGISVVGISLISNYASGISEKKLSHQEVIEISEKNKHFLGNIIKEVISIL